MAKTLADDLYHAASDAGRSPPNYHRMRIAQEERLMEQPKEYRKSETYRQADAAARKILEQYKRDQKFSDEQMSWQMYLEDLRAVPKEEKQKGNHPAEMLVLGSMATFLLAANMEVRSFLLVASAFFIFAAGLYLTGALNPYSTGIRKVKKQLKKSCPGALPYREWKKSKD